MSSRCTAWPLGLAFVSVALVACDSRGTAPSLNTEETPAVGSSRRLIVPDSVPTYEGSGQVVHPDVVYTPPGVFAYPWHLALTPYPFGMGEFENPSVYASTDGVTWMVEPGVLNPVSRPRTGSKVELLSDPALVYVPESSELWLYYRSYTADSDVVWTMRSTDAVHWSSPVAVLEAGAGQALSPSIVRRGPGDWLMWTVSGRCVGGAPTHVDLRTSPDGLAWSPPQPLTLAGLAPWHVFVRWVASLSLWVMATNVKTTQGGCLTTRLYLAFSSDGVQWKHGRDPWLKAGGDSLGLFSSVVYRSAFAEVADSLRFWYSGAAVHYATNSCERGQALCTDSTLRWSVLGTEIRRATDVLPRWLPHAQ